MKPADLDLSPAEVAQLWWFSDGAIMDPSTRQALRRSWGLCSRHTWAYFLIECELRWQPLGTAVLYLDLMDRVLDAWPHRWLPARARRRTFAGHPSCPTCDYVGRQSDVTGFTTQRERVNRRTRGHAFVAGCRADWQQLMCPWCVTSGPGPPCRRHLASGDSPVDRTVRTHLIDLRARLERCMRSMTPDGPAPAAESNAALVATLGWFAGWQPALALAPDAWSQDTISDPGEAR